MEVLVTREQALYRACQLIAADMLVEEGSMAMAVDFLETCKGFGLIDNGDIKEIREYLDFLKEQKDGEHKS